MSYHDLAIDALSKAMGYDPYLPQSDAMIAAWAEALEDAQIDSWADVEMAVRVMYRVHGDPGFRPTPKVLVDTAKQCRELRLKRQPDAQIEGPKRYTFAEFRERHPDVRFPKVGRGVGDVGG